MGLNRSARSRRLKVDNSGGCKHPPEHGDILRGIASVRTIGAILARIGSSAPSARASASATPSLPPGEMKASFS